MADSGAYDVRRARPRLPVPARSRARSPSPSSSGAELVAATADRPDVLPVFVSLTSGDVTAEVEAQMDAAGGVPILRGTRRPSARSRSWPGGSAGTPSDWPRGPVRERWPALARRRRRRYGPTSPRTPHRAGRDASRPARVIPERESLELLRAAGLPIVASVAIEGRRRGRDGRRGARPPQTGSAGRSRSSSMRRASPTRPTSAASCSASQDAEGAPAGAPARSAPDATRSATGSSSSRWRGAGVELIVGARRDPQFGPLVLVGLGGILAEAIDDVAVRLAPITVDDAREMLGGAARRAHPRRARGPPGRRTDAARRGRCSSRSAGRVDANPGWLEVDLNPVIAGPSGAPSRSMP